MTKRDDYYLQGAMWHRVMNQPSNRIARQMFKAAIAEDSDFARGYGFLSYAQLIAYLHDWIEPEVAEDADVTLADVLSNAEVAKNKDDDDHENHWSWAAANIYNGDFTTGLAAYEVALQKAETQAIPQNISTLRVENADALMFRGGAAGVQEAIDIVQGEIDAGSFRMTHLWTLGWAYYELGYYEKNKEKEHAATSLKYLLQFRRPDALIQKNMLASYSALGWTEAAGDLSAQIKSRLPAIYNKSLESKWPYFHDRDDRLQRWQDHLVGL
jgi:hypothetical protein